MSGDPLRNALEDTLTMLEIMLHELDAADKELRRNRRMKPVKPAQPACPYGCPWPDPA